jgi:hypothetical protein
VTAANWRLSDADVLELEEILLSPARNSGPA